MSSVSVKIPTEKFVKAVRDKLDELVKWRDNASVRDEKHRKAVEAWQKQVRTSIPKTAKPERVNVSEWNGVVSVEIRYEFPAGKFPEKPSAEKSGMPEGYHLNSQIDELSNALRLLELSDADYINASTYKSVSRYL